jgi:hypothetical protein
LQETGRRRRRKPPSDAAYIFTTKPNQKKKKTKKNKNKNHSHPIDQDHGYHFGPSFKPPPTFKAQECQTKEQKNEGEGEGNELGTMNMFQICLELGLEHLFLEGVFFVAGRRLKRASFAFPGFHARGGWRRGCGDMREFAWGFVHMRGSFAQMEEMNGSGLNISDVVAVVVVVVGAKAFAAFSRPRHKRFGWGS